MKELLAKIYCNLTLLLSPSEADLNIVKDAEMIDYVLKNNLSIIRFGDGEFRFMELKKSTPYQKYDPKLCEELKEIFYGYDNNSKYLLSVTSYFEKSGRWFKEKPPVYTLCHAPWRLFFRKHRNKTLKYGDAFIFSHGNINIYEKLWKDEKELILIHNDKKWADFLEKQYKTSVKFIKIPSKNAYDEIDAIESKIRELSKNSRPKVLISAGPMAKPLVYRLSKDGYICYDTGHCFDKPLKKA